MNKAIRKITVPSLALVACATLLLAQATQPTTQPDAASDNERTVTPSGLTIITLEKSTGAQPGDTAQILYTGRLSDGHVFDASSRHGNTPLPVRVAGGQMVRGFDEGIIGMHVGEKRRLIIPPELGFGERGRGEIPPNATLEFDIELVSLDRRSQP